MKNSLLAFVTTIGSDGTQRTYFDNNAEALVYAIIGIVVVFVGILILIGLLYLVGFIFKKLEDKKLFLGKRNDGAQPEEKPDDGDIPDEVKAAVVAAVMAYYQSEKPHCEFTVKRIKRL